MKLLLDTHLLVWVAGQSSKLSKAAKSLLSNRQNELLFSAASLWEISIKHTLQRADFRVDPRALQGVLLSNGYVELAVTARHATAVAEIHTPHKDPFDRILLAQAIVEGATLVTVDRKLVLQGGPVRGV